MPSKPFCRKAQQGRRRLALKNYTVGTATGGMEIEMQTLVYVLRHGQSEGNLVNAFVGWGNARLTPKGEHQAALAHDFLESIGVSIDRAYSSTLIRAERTAEIASGLPVTTLDDLREIHAGEWEGKAYADLCTLYPESYGVWLKDVGAAKADGGETVVEMSRRVVAAICAIAKENPGKTVLVGCHGTPIRAIETAARGLSAAEMAKTPWASNASLSCYLCDGERISPVFYSLDYYLGDERTVLPKNV